jgi:hypothetical protein
VKPFAGFLDVVSDGQSASIPSIAMDAVGVWMMALAVLMTRRRE